MEREIEFKKENSKYIFKEKDKENKIEIDEKEKTLSGLELYNQFFKDYSIEDSFKIKDCTSAEEKKDDKICNAIYIKISELFNSINENLKAKSNISAMDSKENKTE